MKIDTSYKTMLFVMMGVLGGVQTRNKSDLFGIGDPIIFKFLHGCGINLNEVAIFEGDTWRLIHTSANRGNHSIMKALIECGVDINAKDNKWNTPLHLACINNSYRKIELLIQSGADMNAKNKDGKFPWEYGSRPLNASIFGRYGYVHDNL